MQRSVRSPVRLVPGFGLFAVRGSGGGPAHCSQSSEPSSKASVSAPEIRVVPGGPGFGADLFGIAGPGGPWRPGSLYRATLPLPPASC